MRIRRKRRKGVYAKRVIGKNCRFLQHEGRMAKCGLRGEPCRKTDECGYEEKSRTVDRLMRMMEK